MPTRGRIGVFGGTFDPPHLGHLIVASEAFELLRLDRLIFMPSAQPPHKRGTVRTAAETRLRMVRGAIAGDARFEASDLELRRAGPSYTADTLREMHRLHPGSEFFFLLGVDQYRELHTWHEPQTVASLAALVVLSRAGEHAEISDALPAEPLPVARIDISATALRARAAEGKSLRYLVPDKVREVVERERLYAG